MKKVVFLAVMATVFVSCKHNEEEYADLLIKEIVKISKWNTPIMLQNGIRMDSISQTGPKSLTYFYTLVGLTRDEVTLEISKPEAVNLIKKNEKLSDARLAGIVFNFKYLDKDGTYAAGMSIGPKDYQ